MNPARSGRTLQAIDLVRTAAILLVLSGHLRPSVGFPATDWGRWFWNALTLHMGYGVTVFFVVSGFLITKLLSERPEGLGRPNLRGFYARRVGRLLPLGSLTVLFGALMVLFGAEDTNRFHYVFLKPGTPLDAWFFVSIGTLSFNWMGILRSATHSYALHWSVLWSLAVEEQFYLGYPWILRRLGGLRPLVWFLVLVSCLGPAYRLWALWAEPDTALWSDQGSFSGFEGIALGALTYLAYQRRVLADRGSSIRSAFLGPLGFGMGLASYLWMDQGGAPFQRVFGPTGISLGTALFILASLQWPWMESKRLAPLALPGRYSYGMYLMHGALIYFLHPTIRPLPTWAAWGIFVGVTTGLAGLSYRLFEVHANLAIRKWLDGNGKNGFEPRGKRRQSNTTANKP